MKEKDTGEGERLVKEMQMVDGNPFATQNICYGKGKKKKKKGGRNIKRGKCLENTADQSLGKQA